MRNLLIISAGLVVALGVVSTTLWRDLRYERQVNVDVRGQLTQAMATPRMSMPAPVVVAAPVVAVAATPAAAPPACKPVPERAPDPVAVTLPLVDGRVVTGTPRVTEQDLLKDPEYRKARLAQQRLQMQRSNPGVAEALGLSEKEADKLLDLLADGQLRMNEIPPAPPNTDPRANAQEMAQRRQLLQKEQDQALLGLLGVNGVAQWQEYQQTRGARTQAVSMGSELLQMGLPLTNAQMKPLTAALVAEQERRKVEQLNIVRNITATDPQARAAQQAAQQEESQRRNAESNRRLLAAVSPSLSPQQVAVLRQQFESQEVTNRISTRARNGAAGAPRAVF